MRSALWWIPKRRPSERGLRFMTQNVSTTPTCATPEGSRRYASRFPAALAAGFYRSAAGLEISSLGLGTYMGGMDEAADRGYVESVIEAVRGGVNLLDTAINYRHQKSERNIGAALSQLFAAGDVGRDELIVCTKAGYLTPGAEPDFLRSEDVAGGMHSMAPDFLADQIDRSRKNLGLDTLDLFYLHNPETQLEHVSREEFDARIRKAFARLEQLAASGVIQFYGAATWNGFRVSGQLDLESLAAIAREEGGDGHHFRFIQLPFNLGMIEALHNGVLGKANTLGVTVIASASLLQTRVLGRIPEQLAAVLPGLATDAQRAIQFTRSTPGITAALVGMSQAAHVRENLKVAAVEPANWLERLQASAPASKNRSPGTPPGR
jgi:aryl-alcohol dehydrogenase-like predicted oxidoreductase